MEGIVYIRLRHRVQVKSESLVNLGQLAQIIAPDGLLEDLKRINIHQVAPSDRNIIVIDIMTVISRVSMHHPGLEFQTIGPAQSIIEVIYEKKKVSLPLFAGVWLLLFIGAAMAIMNFHEDVSMREVHQTLYHFITGEVDPHPLMFQIPYSFGLGLGMILFFNHIFRKRLNEEPSPLEIEMFNYQQDLDQYVIMNENKESMKRLDDD
ncbi:stage V sporulation protein AA [[Bacillus] enclensis]|jgi:stage V sporulation protein AA|uniref:Stage V sporulation protein AA n=2 Tax=Rossellomorea TaxID=2837508 RepID=A0A0V8HM49_9BACI|nr:stage V sporulation protein AA [[Bacillus] enclensis]OAT84089.1 stage V sporulation protein AA [Bacillus sp. MKU004]QTC43385.1 stage V sporulation protein AA [Bacillus sp. V3]QWC21552.1 stage V sporulation protein AA [Bacillus haikouensis]KSU63528.1 stage V sporulation protein AA [[Bacillus] enclensis]MBH9968348.1 stage V sporulation protein AA [[Bacillus] enclensis]